MPNDDLNEFITTVMADLRERGIEAVRMWKNSVQAGRGGDLVIRAPFGKRVVPEAGFRTEGFPD